MMLEWKQWWRTRKSRRQFLARLRLTNPWHAFLYWWRVGRHSRHFGSPVSVRFKTYHGHQHGCYCRTGHTTALHVELFGCWFGAELSRDCTARPCSCDKIVWLLCPDDHAEEIEDYGGIDKLRAEFPGVEPI